MAIAFEPLPLVIGVTGHVDLRESDVPQLRQEVEAIFERLEREYANPYQRGDRMRRRLPGGGDKLPAATPMIVLSALAPGAGQLVTQIALTRGIRVIAPLPLPREQYRRDFEWDPDNPDMLMTFDAWMARSDIRKLFVGFDKGNAAENVWPIGERRNLQYRRAGTFIARHCDILIALWDGKPDPAAGSVAEIIDFKRRGLPLDFAGSARASLDAPEAGPVIHVVTPRSMAKDTADAVLVRSWGAGQVRREADAARKHATPTEEEIAALDHDFKLWRSFEESIRQTRDFNHDAVQLLTSAQGRASAGQSFFDLFEVEKSKQVTKASALQARALAPRWCDLFAVTDALALERQNAWSNDWRWLFGLGLFAFAYFEALAHLAPLAGRLAETAMLAGWIVAVAAIVVLYAAALRGRHQERFLDYRALAEALRIAAFWKLAGLERAISANPIRMPKELSWARIFLLRQELLDKTSPSGPVARRPFNQVGYDWIRRIWMTGRLAYFKETRSQCLKAATWRERASAILLGLGALAAVLLMAARDAGSLHNLLLFAVGFLPAGAAALAACSEKLAFRAAAQRYDRIAEVFAHALSVLPPSLDESNTQVVRDAVRELGAETLRETAEWVAVQRPRWIAPDS